MRTLLAFLTIWLAAANASSADISVTVQPLTLAPGQSGLLEVDFSTTGSPAVAQDEFGFSITANNSPGLHFNSSPDPSIDPTFANPAYIFAGNSLDQILGTGFNLATAAPSPGQTIVGGDSTFDGSNATLTSGLLAYLPVTADPSAHSGDTFSINLMPAFTQFNDNGDPANLFSFAGTPGLVTISGTVLTPEPSSIVAWSFFVAAGSIATAWRRRKRAV